MGENSGIAWTHHTFNPWWGCSRVSPGCEHCYAERLATVRRKLPVWGVDAARKPMSEAYWRAPLKWNRDALAAGERRRVFCASMADVFELAPVQNEEAHRVMVAARERLWRLIESTSALDWLLLTKRPQNVDFLVPWGGERRGGPWPANVWLGVTAEDERRARERIPILLGIPARVRFVSHEPALERVDFFPFLGRGDRHAPLDWIITGGESGPGARPYDPDWARLVVAQCRIGGAAPFVKQMGAAPVGLELRAKKGDDPSEWPADLRVQEFPR